MQEFLDLIAHQQHRRGAEEKPTTSPICTKHSPLTPPEEEQTIDKGNWGLKSVNLVTKMHQKFRTNRIKQRRKKYEVAPLRQRKRERQTTVRGERDPSRKFFEESATMPKQKKMLNLFDGLESVIYLSNLTRRLIRRVGSER